MLISTLKMLEYISKDKTLHIIYKNIKDIPLYINTISDEYEGKIKDRIGLNFPLSFVNKCEKNKKITKKEAEELKKYHNIEYIIVYKKGDIITKNHEELHSKYYVDSDYKKKVKEYWNSLTKSSKEKVLYLLEKMKYPKDNEEILIDEFQAYLYSENKNFFGKLE
jgi:hypothetical protein